MLRRIPCITAVIVALAAAGCSSGDRDHAATTTQAQTAGPLCGHGSGPMTVTLLSFDAQSLELDAFDSNGFLVTGWLTSDTRTIPADLGAFPPDPIFPQCGNDAAAYDRVVGDRLTDAVGSQVTQLATDGCNASVTVSRDGTVTSFQPVP
jgi:hypothetical protein